MKHFLDTGTVLAALAGDPAVLERLFALPRTDVLIPQPVVAGILHGIALLPDPALRDRIEGRLNRFLENAAAAPWTTATSRAYATARADLAARDRRMGAFEVAVAAHPLAAGGVLVTGEPSRMAWIRDLLLDNWQDPARF